MIRPPPWARRWGRADRMTWIDPTRLVAIPVVDLGLSQFFSCAEEAIAGVAHDHVDPPDLGE
jgi:hypothetical protein